MSFFSSDFVAMFEARIEPRPRPVTRKQDRALRLSLAATRARSANLSHRNPSPRARFYVGKPGCWELAPISDSAPDTKAPHRFSCGFVEIFQ